MKQLEIPTQFTIGDYYSNDQIHYALDLANSGGIRPKLKDGILDFIVLFTSQEEKKISQRNPYADRIEENILTYTGAGLRGEQTFSGGNRRILEQRNEAVPILGFAKEETNRYKFIGFLFLLRNYQDYQLDQSGLMRKALMYEFQIISDFHSLPIGQFREYFSPIYEKLKSEVLEDDRVVINVEEELDSAEQITELREIEELKSKLIVVDPYKFEFVVSHLVTHIGFSDVKVTKKSGDGGIDVLATLTNPVSTNLHYLFQVKRWKRTVGRNEVANLRGSMALNNQATIITTGQFTAGALLEAGFEGKIPIHLIGIESLYRIIRDAHFDVDKYLN